MRLTFRDIVWVAIITIIVIALSKCHRDINAELKEGIKVLRNKHNQDSSQYATQIQQKENVVDRSIKLADSIGEINKYLESLLDSKAATVIKLSTALQKSKKPGIDTNFITVDQDYVTYCDSLAFKATDLALNYSTYKNNTNRLIAAKDDVIKEKDTVIAIERTAKQNCYNDYNTAIRLYQDYQKANKPTNQVYIGAELIGNPQYVVSNVGLALTLKTKSNKLWQVSGGVQTNGQYYARINGNILIKLKP